MSISSRITSMEEHVTNAYNGLQGLGADLTGIDKNIDNIASLLDDIYDSLPSVSGEGTSLTLDDTRVGKIKSTLKGNTSQTGTPTPSSPIPVNVVSGDNEIVVCGKNLFDKNNIFVGYLREDGTVWSDTAYRTSAFMPIRPNTTYYKTSTVSPRTKYFDINKVPLNTTTYWDVPTGGSAGTFTTPDNAYYLRFSFPFTGSSAIDADTIMVKEGTDTTYEPYQGSNYAINLGVENLFEGVFEEGGWDIGNGQKQYAPGRNRCPDLIPVNPSTTYTISFENTGTCYVLEYGSNSDYLTYSQVSYRTYNGSFTTNANTRYITFYYIPYNHDFTLNEECQLEKGPKANSYTPYGTTPIELCKIGNYKDYFYKDSDKWYLHKEIGKVVLNGSESWGKSSKTQVNRYYVANIFVTILSASSIDLISNYFVCITPNQSDSNNIGLAKYNENGLMVNFSLTDTNFDTLEKFKTWLTSNNVLVRYVLATPTYNKITYEPLLEQLEAYYHAKSRATQTNISQENNDLPFEIDASALKEWQESASLNSTLSMVNPLSLGNTLNTQEIENDIQPTEVDNIEPLEEEENEES